MNKLRKRRSTPIKHTAVALLNAILMLTLISVVLVGVTHSYQQQQQSYRYLLNYYQAKTLYELTLASQSKAGLKGIKATTGESQILMKQHQIKVILKNGYQKQFEIKNITGKK
ncbi:hypothetical protein ACPBEH_11040 [Latilactobacillus sp. 5-91]|uniref:hypothetical protein n=1 Tax=Latilactobacillus sp. 5-91 TaxID=3410924 RepID=UPI003C78BD0D